MKFVLLLVATLMVAALAHPKWNKLAGYTFEQYVKDFRKSYRDAAEHSMRKRVFEEKLASIQKFNSEPGHSWRKGINHMSDWTPEETKIINGGRSSTMKHLANKELRRPYQAGGEAPLPKSVDWRNVVPPVLTSVKDQGQCGSCWAHGATEQIETYTALANGLLFVLSQQQITACTQNPQQCGGTGGCSGATAELGYELAVNQSIVQEWEYPYLAYSGNTGTCESVSGGATDITGYVTLPANNQQAVMQSLAQIGPLAVNVDASGWSDYETGVFSGCNYSNNISIDHVVQLVGYGYDSEAQLSYWIVRNSWSPSYGEAGYIRVLRTETAECGWDVNAQGGYACAGGPTQLWVCGMCGILGDTSYPIAKPQNN